MSSWLPARRSNSWFDFLREGTVSSLPPGIEIPPSMLAQFPEEVQDPRILSVADVNRGICPRILQSKNCDKMTNCPYLHPDFMSGKWVVPDLICHKWFQGVCHYGGRCCNQHGGTFDDAMRRAVRAQQQLRRDRPPFSFDSVDGGTTRQVNPDDASRMISNRMTLYRLNTARNSRFGTNYTLYYEYDMLARSADARHFRADDEERRGGQRATSPVGRGRGTSPRRASSKAPSRHAASWTDRRPHTPMRASLDRRHLHRFDTLMVLPWKRSRMDPPLLDSVLPDPPSAKAMRGLHGYTAQQNAGFLRPRDGWMHRQLHRSSSRWTRLLQSFLLRLSPHKFLTMKILGTNATKKFDKLEMREVMPMIRGAPSGSTATSPRLRDLLHRRLLGHLPARSCR